MSNSNLTDIGSFPGVAYAIPTESVLPHSKFSEFQKCLLLNLFAGYWKKTTSNSLASFRIMNKFIED